MGTPHAFYDAADGADLDAVLATIGTQTVSCVYELESEPPNPDEVYVFFDGTDVPRDGDHSDGWDYDPGTNKLTFYGAACDELKQGDVTDLEIVYGCDAPPPR
jgi:hypothetical protein